MGAGRTVAGRYHLRERIGSGGMGTVWRADDAVLHREVAVKELTAFAGGDGGGPRGAAAEEELRLRRERCVREARAVARIDHPGVVRVHDVVDDHGQLWIVMELVRAPSLASVLETRGPMPADGVAALGAQLAHALAAVHAAGVLHRDVKPGNVLLRGDGRAVLTDFGIAVISGDEPLTRSGQLVGSPEYMAPERLTGGGAGPASDVWALGATLGALLAGKSPFRRGDLPATLHAITSGQPELPQGTGPVGEVVRAMLHRDPARRPDAAEAARLLETGSEPPRRRRAAVLVPVIATAAAVVVGTGAAVLLADPFGPHHTAAQPRAAVTSTITVPPTTASSAPPSSTPPSSAPPSSPDTPEESSPPPAPSASSPSPSPTHRTETVSVQVDSTSGWQSTGLTVRSGERIGIDFAGGGWSVDHRYFPNVGPGGYDSATDARIYQGCKYDKSLPYGVLLGRVGGGSWFAVGSRDSITAPGSGALQFRIHDQDHCLVDNAGSLLLKLTHTTS
ncbi:serine/threonine-protein kinase [Actinomadura rupiterrae]|uniref:serine/threonine-protein kinase n=1 Tax=Actinomadura rupiterrae TaxID=559627 RepID=UPI0020A2AA18|nr:serine/threonine-protein kinase [Actinomadura rupiterrae]